MTPLPNRKLAKWHLDIILQVRVQGGGRACPPPPPPEIEKQKKKVIRANFKLFHLYFATFLVENVIFSAIFWAGPPPLKNWKAKKKAFRFWTPPPYEFLDTRLYCKNVYIIIAHILFYALLQFLVINYTHNRTGCGGRGCVDNLWGGVAQLRK